MILGIDEAGRGPAIGPMVLAGVKIKKDKEHSLRSLDVKDSKKLSKKRREELFKKIEDISEKMITIIIDAKEIDRLRESKSMNIIELEAFAKIINESLCDRIYLDLPERNSNFCDRLKDICKKDINLTAEHKADDKYPIVSAASIIAKVTRDNIIKDIEKELGTTVGSGYPSDPKTKRYLKDEYRTNKCFPVFVRHSWKTIINIKNSSKQNMLSDFS